MTVREFEAAFRAARKTYPRLTRQAMQNMLVAYEQAGRLAAEQVLTAKIMDYSNITVESWARLQRALENGADMVRAQLDVQTRALMMRGVQSTSEIQAAYIMDAVAAAGATGRITLVGIENVFASVNQRVVRSVINRVFTDGYTFSQRIWEVGVKYQNDIKNVVSAGLAQGRSTIDIAKDIQGYIQDGKPWLVNRYGPNLERGTPEFISRIGDSVDARALRLARSELYMSLQEANREQGHAAPSCTDLYDWVLQGGRQDWDCECPDLASGGPYEYNSIPSYPHPHCVCEVRPQLRDRQDFINDLSRWSDGETVDYLDNWEKNIYAPNA